MYKGYCSTVLGLGVGEGDLCSSGIWSFPSIPTFVCCTTVVLVYIVSSSASSIKSIHGGAVGWGTR